MKPDEEFTKKYPAFVDYANLRIDHTDPEGPDAEIMVGIIELAQKDGVEPMPPRDEVIEEYVTEDD